NYNHLMEQPTIFYALAFITYLAGAQSPFAAALAWAYVGLRIVHSLIQNTINRVALRFLVFSLSTIALIVWAGCLALETFGG
ncbi:MAG TPA: MAPEG family protein, partial [Caulobacter sp.]|nr:MAPEG family protein [Caulobacter sp.]